MLGEFLDQGLLIAELVRATKRAVNTIKLLITSRETRDRKTSRKRGLEAVGQAA